MILIVGGCVGFRGGVVWWMVRWGCEIGRFVCALDAMLTGRYRTFNSLMACDNMARRCGTVDSIRLSRVVLRV